MDDSLALFHPVIQEWFRNKFKQVTLPQQQGWPLIASGEDTLIAAPTGSGKTLTAFLAIIDRLFREGIRDDARTGVQVVYVSPLRALSNDMEKNLQGPLQEIVELAGEMGLELPALQVGLRTGDTNSYRRQQLVKKPPHILVTTPESLYLMLTAEKSREVLSTVDTVIVDEIHALVRDKRGSHLALTLERLESLVTQGGKTRFQRIGLSATQKPIERMAEFLVGKKAGDTPLCQIVDVGHRRDLDVGIETPPSELQAVCSNEQWGEINARLVELIHEHRSTLVFVNTRRMAERVTFQLSEILGEACVGTHHGSLSKESRLDTEQKLKTGQLKAVVATASLELGIDVGYIDLVVQLGSPRGIAPFLQRIGRSGHSLGLTPKGRLFALTRDELVECMALIRAINAGRLDVIPIPIAPVDILSQQVVAELACDEWTVEDLFNCFCRAWPYHTLTREKFEEILTILNEGITDTSGRKQALIYYDRVNQRLKGRPAARLTAINNGGAIPEIDSMRVVLEDENTVVGSVDEEFGFESSAGDIFLLGNNSWRIRGMRGLDLIVADAHGAPPTVPFWRGEAPGRTLELSEEISLLRELIEEKLIAIDQSDQSNPGSTGPELLAEDAWKPIVAWLVETSHCNAHAAWQIVNYIAAQRAAVGFIPSQKRILFERFFDESGGMQLVVHAPFGTRINKAWGFAFRKRFCRSFDFELQATADDDGFILSLGPQHSFPLESLFPFMRTDNARNLLEQALLIAPIFHARWRWNVTRALLMTRMRNGKKVPPALQRFRSEDLLTAVFPKLTGCQEEHMGDHEIPDHPIMKQTVHDCMTEALDLAGLLEVLRKYEAGEITYVARDTREPSPFAYELLNANPYAFLDGGEANERRSRAVATRRSLTVDSVKDLGQLDRIAIESVVEEAQPLIRDEDELHDLLLTRYLIPSQSNGNRQQQEPYTNTKPLSTQQRLSLNTSEHEVFLYNLQQDGRIFEVYFGEHQRAWIPTERWTAVQAISPDIIPVEETPIPNFDDKQWTSVESLSALLRGWIETSGPVTAIELAELLKLPVPRVFAALEGIEGEGQVLRGRFLNSDPNLASDSHEIEWCHRGLLARIHRRTINGLRKEIEAVEIPVYMEFLSQHQGVLQGFRKQQADGVHEVISQLQGTDVSAAAWEESVLPARIDHYKTSWLDELCMSGDIGWGRLEPTPEKKTSGRGMTSITRAVPISLFLREDLDWLVAKRQAKHERELSTPAQHVLEFLTKQGALFANDILKQTDMLPTHLNEALGELVAAGLITSDGFSGLRKLTNTNSEKQPHKLRSRKVRVRQPAAGIGRWNLWQPDIKEMSNDDVVEEWAWQLIRRWGVVFRELAMQETLAPRWWELARAFRRLEARGEIRGGRFIKGVGGEQFGTSDAIREIRAIRQQDKSERNNLVVVCGSDPLNLTGHIGKDSRIPSLATNRVAYLRGEVVGWKKGEETWIKPSLNGDHYIALEIQFGLRPKHHAYLATNQTNTVAPLTTDTSKEKPSQEKNTKPKRRKPRQASKQVPKPFPF